MRRITTKCVGHSGGEQDGFSFAKDEMIPSRYLYPRVTFFKFNGDPARNVPVSNRVTYDGVADICGIQVEVHVG